MVKKYREEGDGLGMLSERRRIIGWSALDKMQDDFCETLEDALV